MTKDELKTILNEAGSQLVSVRFIKRDGSPRTLVTNPRQVLETLGTGKSSDKVVTIVDIKKNLWRSIRPESIVSVKTGGHLTIA